MTKLVNRAKMTTATTGTGTITLGSAVDGYQTFAAAGVVNGDVVRYVIEDGSAWEIGLGTYSTTGTTLTRGSIESSNADNAINLTGNAVVYVSAAAADLQELVDFADNFVLPTADGTNGQVLTTNGSGTLTFSTISGYTNADVDAHLNTGTAASGEVLSWNGADYDWVAAPAALLGDTDSASPFETSLGFEAGLNNTGVYATFVGYQAGKTTTTAQKSTGLGAWALFSQTSGSRNVGVGYAASYTNVTGEDNTAVGDAALYNSTGSYNSFLGSGSGFRATTGARNNAVGYQALYGGVSNLTGSDNVGIGYQTGYDLTTGANNFLGGYRAGHALTTGSNNVAIGNGALDAATTGGRNIAIGQDAMGLGVATAASGDNVAIGYQAGYYITSATSNVLLGYSAGWDITTGTGNVAIGQEAGDAITTGGTNVAIGLGCLSTITTASSDIAIGYNAMVSATSTSPDNIAIGQDVMRAVSSGGNNTGVGAGSLRSLGVGSNNTAFGYGALKGTFGSASHSNNTGVGHSAGLLLTTGTNNTFVGYQAGDATTTGSNQIVIGNGADASSATVSNEITLGNSSITTLRCQVTTITSLSDARDKTDIQPLNAGLEFVEALNPVSFTWNMRDGGKVGEADTGFIAQDLQMAQEWAGVTIPGLVYDVNPDKLEAGYGKLIPVLVQAIKDLSAKVNLLEAQLEAQK